MRRDVWTVPAPSLGAEGRVVAYGHWGTPILFFPAEGGSALDVEHQGIIDALAEPLENGTIKVFGVDSNDGNSWSNRNLPTEERAQIHNAYHEWIVNEVAGAIHQDCGGFLGIATAGVSLGAYHAVNVALRRADLFPHAVGMSGSYDPTTWHGWGDLGDATYFNNPFAYVANMDGDHLEWLRSQVFIQLCVGTGAWEVSPTQALPSSKALARLLWDKHIPCDLDVWGEDSPHDWPSWRRMVVKHLAPLG